MQSWSSTKAMIEAAKEGDRMAFNGLVGKFEPALESFVRRQAGKRLQGKVEIEDLLQESFLRAFRSFGRFEGNDEKAFLAWLRTIAEHVILDCARKLRAGKGLLEREVSLDQKRRAGSGESWEIENAVATAREDTPSEAMRREERFERLKRGLEGLKPEYSRVIYLARVRGLPIAEVARRMDRTPEAISMLLLRALVKLKSAFGETESFHLPDRSLEAEGDHHEG
jgi:RNA polymerase sigma-70 factor, ECF subfamily